MRSAPDIGIEDLTLGYDGHPAVHHLDGSFAGGSLTAVVGPNGSGKSTLLKGIVGALKPIGGSVRWGTANPRIAYLPQSAEVDRSFPATVFELVALGLWPRRGLFGAIDKADEAEIEATLEAVGLVGFENRPLDTLSGGQAQRALFARVMLQDADVILLDEPFTAIDERTTADLVQLIRRWHGERRTVIAVLHDNDLVRSVFPQTLLMAREPVAWGATEDVLCTENQAKARHMTEAWDEHAPWHDGAQAHRHGAHA